MGKRAGRSLTVLVVAIASMLSMSGLAQAQGLSICEQYPDTPTCQPAGDGGGPNGPAAANPAGTADSLGAASGSLPFTGYPISPMILFALLLILIGLLVRATSAAGRRARTLAAGSGPQQR